MLTDTGVVMGVDTHKHTHTAAALSATGAVIEHLTVPADPRGYRRLEGASGSAMRRRCVRSTERAASEPG